jgi:membrane protein required for colicin V production
VNSLDAVFIIVCLGFVGLGFSHGFIKSVSSLIAILVGLFCAKKLEPFVSKILAFIHVGNPKGLLGYLFVFFCIFIGVKVLLLVFQKLTKAAGLSPIDRILGAFLGVVKGIIITAIISVLIQVALPAESAVLTNSRVLPYTNKVVSSARVMLPAAIYEHVIKGRPLDIKNRFRERVGNSLDKGTAKDRD